MIDKTIDPARTGISKSTLMTPCARKAFYTETVRDAQGRRLRFPMPEKVVFGTAIDYGHARLVWARLHDEPVDLGAVIDSAVTLALTQDCSESIEDAVFRLQVTTALRKLTGELPNRTRVVRGQFVPDEEPDGFGGTPIERIPLDGLTVQGDNGRSLRWEDVVGTPDYDGPGVIDVKTSARAYGASRFWTKPEMPVYALLHTAEHGGELPAFLAYHVYVRAAKPYWQWLSVPCPADYVALGQMHAAHWRAAMEVHEPDLFAVDLAYCGECPYREALPEYGHGGCAIGQAVVALGSTEEAA